MNNLVKGFLFTGALAVAAVPLMFVGSVPAAEYDFSLGVEARYLDYEEPGVMEEDGSLYGISGKYVSYGNNLVSELSVSYLEGELDYDGETWGGAPLKAETDDWIAEARYLLGREFGTGLVITPFAGVGYRYWNNDINGQGGYERDVIYWYSPVGLRLTTPRGGLWHFGLSAEYDVFWRGKVKSHISDVDPGYNDPEVDQEAGDGYGLRLTGTIRRELTPHYALMVEPYLIYWDIDESETETLYYNGSPQRSLFEPENETLSYGCRLHFLF